MFKFVMVIIVSILAAGCNIGNTNHLPLASIGGSVNAGAVATIPILANANSSTMMVVNNNTDSNLKLINTTVKVNGLILSLEQKKQLIDVSGCSTLSPNNQCKVIITPPREDGGFVINMQYTDDHGVIYNTAQLITYSSLVSQNNGLIYFKPNQLKFKPGKNAISIPIMLASKHQGLNPAINNFFPGATTKIYCPNQELNSGDMCTLIVNFSITENNMRFLDITDIPQVILSATLDGDSPTQSEQTHAIFLSVSSNNAGNLITNGINVQISPTLNPIITLFNNGKTAVTNIQFESITPLILIPSGATPCGATLNSGSSCTFTLYTDSSATTGATNVLISYNNGLGTTNSLAFNAYYTSAAPAPLLIESNNGWLVNTPTNSINYQGIYVTNNGNITLNNLQFGGLGPTGMSYGGYGQTCVNGQSLAPLASCMMLINYYPIAATTGVNTFNVTTTASYPDQSGTAISYLANLIMQYSANSSTLNANYVVAGDYGAISNSTLGVASWTAINMTPFVNTSTAITRMVNNGNLQVLGNNLGTSGQDIYSADRGMIWGSDNYSVAGSVTGLTYDSTNGYLVISAGGAGYLFYANPISGSTTYWAHTSSSWFPNTGGSNPTNFYDFNGQYFALVSQSTYIDYSTTPINSAFAAVTGTITTGTYVGMIYDGTYIFAVNSNMVICAPSGTISSWACSSNHIYPSGTLTGVGNNGTINSYVGIMSTTPWVIYTAAYPYSQNWTAASTSPGIPLKWVTYGASGGYIAVSAGTPGTIWTSPTGNIWTQQTQGTANNPVNESYNFAYYDGTNYWAAGNNILKVSANGVNWSNAGIKDIGITYVNGNLIYLAVGTAGAIESSTDLSTWNPANLSITSQLNSVQCFNSNNCYIVGNNGSILFSNNGLATAWIIESANTLQNLTGIACGYTNCVIVGSNGTILTESIGSNTWSIDNSPTSQTLNSVAFNNIFNIYVAVGNNGVILSSTDGVNWTQRAAGLTSNNLTSVVCAYSQIGCMAVGAAGTIITSLNGISWQSGTSVTGAANSIAFYNGVWLVAGNAGLITTAPDVATPSALAWTSRSSGLTIGANLNLNTALGF